MTTHHNIYTVTYKERRFDTGSKQLTIVAVDERAAYEIAERYLKLVENLPYPWIFPDNVVKTDITSAVIRIIGELSWPST